MVHAHSAHACVIEFAIGKPGIKSAVPPQLSLKRGVVAAQVVEDACFLGALGIV